MYIITYIYVPMVKKNYYYRVYKKNSYLIELQLFSIQ